jgi:hypothetical protein
MFTGLPGTEHGEARRARKISGPQRQVQRERAWALDLAIRLGGSRVQAISDGISCLPRVGGKRGYDGGCREGQAVALRVAPRCVITFFGGVKNLPGVCLTIGITSVFSVGIQVYPYDPDLGS